MRVRLPGLFSARFRFFRTVWAYPHGSNRPEFTKPVDFSLRTEGNAANGGPRETQDPPLWLCAVAVLRRCGSTPLWLCAVVAARGETDNYTR